MQNLLSSSGLKTCVDWSYPRKNRTGGRTSLSLLLQCLAQYDIGVAIIGRNHFPQKLQDQKTILLHSLPN